MTVSDASRQKGLIASGKRGLIVPVGLVLIPVIVGIKMARDWADADDTFYATTAQVIATLFVAIAVDFFANQVTRTRPDEAILTLLLVGESWVGFFASMRGLAAPAGTAWTAGLAGAGATAASVLLSLALYDQITGRDDGTHAQKVMAALIILLFLGAAVALLLY